MTELVLIGAGHVHTALLGHARTLAEAGIQVTLVDIGSFWFGARRGDLMAGRADASTLRWPLKTLCRRHAVAHRTDRVVGVDTRLRRVWLASGARLDYDLVSFNVGVEVDATGLNAAASRVRLWRASSVQELTQFCSELRASRDGSRVAVVGDSPDAARLAAALSHACESGRHRVAWYLPGDRFAPWAPSGAARRLARTLSHRGVEIVLATPIVGLADGQLVGEDDRRFGVDHLLLAERYRPARVVHAARLPVGDHGMYVTRRLQSPADSRVFAAGACAQWPDGQSLARHDVAGQAKVLAHNTVAVVRRRPLRSVGPRAPASVIDLGDGRALGWHGSLWWHNRWAARAERRRIRRLVATLAID
ncbi:FAD-dependent oxidoreductase [Salinisphaera sp. T31B1]|uniref:FAD-dependent oxidoreductase n=1 Tax=Salinisphaera sp. T31B1 TaxID=727963 RepID=UPI00333F324D